MKIFFQIIFILAVIALLNANCRKVVTDVPPPGQLDKISLENLELIPLEYGELVSVTTHSQYEGWAQLWFVDEDRTIRMVRVQFHTNRLHENVLIIPRKSEGGQEND